MDFNKRSTKSFWWVPVTLSLSAFALNGCGILGSKEPIVEQSASVASPTGCLNEFGEQMNLYLKGKVQAEQWNQSWKCVEDSLRFFKSYVRGAKSKSYSRQEMSNFVSRFLITQNNVSAALIQASFELKSSLIGGNSNEITHEEIDQLLDLMGQLKNASLQVLPHLKARAENPTAEGLLALTESIEKSGNQIAMSIQLHDNTPLVKSTTETLLRELGTLHRWDISNDLVQYFMTAKWFLLNSRLDQIDPKDWPQLIRTLSTLGGVMIAYNSLSIDTVKKEHLYNDFLLKLFLKVKPQILSALAAHGGVIPYPVFDTIIDQLPNDLINVSKPILKQTLRPLLSHVFQAQSLNGLDLAAVNTLYTLIENWIKTNSHLEKIFDFNQFETGGESKPKLAQALAETEKNSPDSEKPYLQQIKKILNYPPLFVGSDDRITFHNWSMYSLKHLSKMVLFEQISAHMLKAYTAITPEGARIQAVQKLVADFQDIGFELKLIDITVPKLAEKRFQEADLFTPVSNGNEILELEEVTFYIAYLFSADGLSSQVRAEVTPKCELNLGKDSLNWTWVDAACFRPSFFGEFEKYLPHFPEFLSFFRDSTADRREEISVNIEKGSRLHGFTNDPLASYDIRGVAGILHYVESLFQRFDVDNDQYLSKEEILEAYPLFEKLLSKMAKSDDRNRLQAIFTYLIYYGEPPNEKFPQIMKFIKWLGIWKLNRTQIWADRGDIYQIVSLFSAPPP